MEFLYHHYCLFCNTHMGIWEYITGHGVCNSCQSKHKAEFDKIVKQAQENKNKMLESIR